MQLFSSLLVNGNNLIAFPKTTKILLVAFKIFNLNFFDLPSLSFCLFEGANSLHLLAFDYVIVIYSNCAHCNCGEPKMYQNQKLFGNTKKFIFLHYSWFVWISSDVLC